MTNSLLFACLWVLAGTFTAFLPMRAQYPIGTALILAMPALLIWLAVDHGWWIAAFGLFAFVSMFRKPLSALARHIFKSTSKVPSS